MVCWRTDRSRARLPTRPLCWRARSVSRAGRARPSRSIRRALTIIVRLVDAPPQAETDASFKTYQDADLFRVRNALVEDLSRQGRNLEADLVTSSLRPYDPQDRAHVDPASFYGSVLGVPPVVSGDAPAPAPVIRAPTDAETQTRTSLRTQAGSDDEQSLYAQSEPLYRSIVALDETTFGPANWETAGDQRALAFNLFLQQKSAEATATEAQAADIEAKRPLATSAAYVSRLEVVATLLSHAAVLEKRSQDPDAEVFWREALRLDPSFRNMFAQDGDRTALGLAENLRRQGKACGGGRRLRAGPQVRRVGAPGCSHPRILRIKEAIAQVRAEEGQMGPAVQAYRQACGDERELVAETKRGERASLASTPLETTFSGCTGEQALAMIAWAAQGGGQAVSDKPPALATDAFVAAQASIPSSAGDALARAAARIAAASGGDALEAAQFETDLAERRRDRPGAAGRRRIHARGAEGAQNRARY